MASATTSLSSLSPRLSLSTDEETLSKNILMVGAGGIGCELIKTLVLTGFQNISIIDLDTIDVSNLNRQFLFRKKHVGMSKSQVAKESVEKFVKKGSINIDAYTGNVKEERFGLEFFKKFDKDHAYIKKWVPDYQTSAYPRQIVDHKMARERCLETYKSALNK